MVVADSRIGPAELFSEDARVVRRPVIDENAFPVGECLSREAAHCFREVARIVVRGDDDANSRCHPGKTITDLK